MIADRSVNILFIHKSHFPRICSQHYLGQGMNSVARHFEQVTCRYS